MEQHEHEEEHQRLPSQQGEDFEIFVLEKIDQPTLQHDQ